MLTEEKVVVIEVGSNGVVQGVGKNGNSCLLENDDMMLMYKFWSLLGAAYRWGSDD